MSNDPNRDTRPGAKARIEGKELSDNPHRLFTEAWQEWRDGWQAEDWAEDDTEGQPSS